MPSTTGDLGLFPFLGVLSAHHFLWGTGVQSPGQGFTSECQVSARMPPTPPETMCSVPLHACGVTVQKYAAETDTEEGSAELGCPAGGQGQQKSSLSGVWVGVSDRG